MKKTNEEYRDELKILYIEKNWLKCYNLALEFCNILKQTEDKSGNNLYSCYIYLSTASRRLGDSQLAIEFGENALKYATNKGEQINASGAIATCYLDVTNPSKAIEEFDKCILLCDKILDEVSHDYGEDIIIVIEGRADCIHNKGDLLNDLNLLNESMVIYKKLLTMESTNKTSLNKKISNAYKNINRIHTQLFTPLAMAF